MTPPAGPGGEGVPGAGVPPAPGKAHPGKAEGGNGKFQFWNKFLGESKPIDPDRPDGEKVLRFETVAGKDRPFVMDKETDKEVVNFLFGNWCTMEDGYRAPMDGSTPVRQEIDIWTEWTVKEILRENGFKKFSHSEEKNRRNMRQFINDNEYLLQNCQRTDTVTIAYLLTATRECELAAAAGISLKERSNRLQGLSDVPRYLGQALGERIETSSALYNVLSVFEPGMPRKGPLAKLAKDMRKRHFVTEYARMDPHSSGYKTAYIDSLGLDPRNEQGRVRLIQLANQADKLRIAMAEGITGIKVGDSAWNESCDVLLIGSKFGVPEKAAAGMQAGTGVFAHKKEVIRNLGLVLENEFKGVKWEDLSEPDKNIARMQALRRTITSMGDEQATEILNSSGDNEYKEGRVTAAKTKLDAQKPEEVTSEKFSQLEEKLKKNLGTVDEGYKAWEKAGEAVDKARKEHRKQETEFKDQKDKATLSMAKYEQTRDAYAPMKPPLSTTPNPASDPDNYRLWDEKVSQANKEITELTAKLAAIPAPTAHIDVETALELTVGDIKTRLGGFATPAEIDLIIDSSTAPPTFKKIEYLGFINAKQVEMRKAHDDATDDIENVKKKMKEGKKVGEAVLVAVTDRRNQVIANIAQEQAEWREMETPEGLAEMMLGPEGAKALPPARIAKLLATFLDIPYIDPSKIPDKDKDAALFERRWKQIVQEYKRVDGYARAKAVMQIYHDRFLAVEEGKPMDDIMEYKMRTKQREIVPIRMVQEFATEALRAKDYLLGDNAIVVQEGNLMFVAKDGKVRIMEAKDLTDYKTGVNDLGLLGLEVQGDRIVVINPGDTTLLERRNRLFRANPDRVIEGLQLFFATKAPCTETIICHDGFTRDVMWDGANIFIVGGQEYVDRGSIDIPIEDYCKAYGYDFLDQEGGGRWALEYLEERSKNLVKLYEAKKDHFKEKNLDPDTRPEELRFAQEGNSKSEIALVLSGDEIKVIRRDQGADGSWVATPELFAATGVANDLTWDQFMGLTDMQDPDGYRYKLGAAAYDLLLAMPQEKRASFARQISKHRIPVDINVNTLGISGSFSAGLDDDGSVVVYDQSGLAFSLPDWLNIAMRENYNPIDRCDELVYPNDAATIRANQAIMIQSAVGSEIMIKGLHQINRV